MEINLLDHCLICLEKTAGLNSFAAADSSMMTPRQALLTFVNKVIPELLWEKSAENEKSLMDLLNQLKFCFLGRYEGHLNYEQVEGQEEREELSPPPLCLSCLEKISGFVQMMEQLQFEKDEFRRRICGERNRETFQSLLRGSEGIEEETKETTLNFLDRLMHDCCGRSIPEAMNDGAKEKASSTISDEDFRKTLAAIKSEEMDDEETHRVVEVPPLDDFQLILNTIKNEGAEEEDTTRVEVNGPDMLFEMGRLLMTRNDIFGPVESEDLQQQQNSLNDVGGAQEPDLGPSPKKGKKAHEERDG